MQRFKRFLQKSSPEKLFLWLGVPVIAIFIIAIPALQGWDETTHFLRAYQVSTGDFTAERIGKQAGGPIPVNVSNMNDDALRDLLLSGQTGLQRKAHLGYYKIYIKQVHPDKNIVNKVFSGSAAYSPVSYGPQATGIFLARTLRLPLLSYIFIGRLFSALAFIGFAYWAIRIIPKGKWVILAVALLPTTLAAASTMSPDALINGASLLLIAIFVKGLLSEKPLRTKYLLAIAASTVVLSLTKETYFLLAFLPLLLPPKRVFGSVKKYLLWNLLFIVLALGSSLAWFSRVGDINKYGYLDNRPNLHVNSVEQTSYIIHQPLHYLSTLSWDFFAGSGPQFSQMVGVLTWKAIIPPFYIIFLIYFGLSLAFLATRAEVGRTPSLSLLQRRISSYGPIIIGILLTTMIYTGLYIYFSTVRETQIEGVQGRYFIPLIGLLLPITLLAGHKKPPFIEFDSSKLAYILPTIFIIQNVAAIFVIVATNYIPHMQFV